MNLGDIGRLLRTNTKEHFPIILSAAAGIGVLATAYLASAASVEAANVIRNYEEQNPPSDDPKERLIERTKLVWKLYIPAGISAASTITCIIGANRVEAKKTIAAQTAFAVSQRVYSDYRDKVIEEYGERKDQSIRDKIADDRVKSSAPSKDVLISGPGNVLCCELFTGRYFSSDMESLRKAQNELNAKLLAHDYATFDDFYYMVGLSRTSSSGQIGWRSNRLMDLQFSTVLTEDGRPCLAFDYNYTEPL
jgi:Family of unknown function (DUF6353)